MSQVILQMKNMFPKITEKLVNIFLMIICTHKGQIHAYVFTHKSSYFYI